MKKMTKALCCLFMIGFFATCALTGCATVGNIINNNEDIIYNGNSAVMVDGYLYYGNSFADYSNFNNTKDYKNSAKTSYLARLNTNVETQAKSQDYSPKYVENVSKEVTAHSKDFMFVLGNYIYYATPNTQKATNTEGATSHYFNYTTIYRSKLNGSGKKKLYTTNGEVSQIEVLKVDGTYYIVIFAGEDLIKINLSNRKSEVIAEGVKSVAVPKTYQQDKLGSTLDWNGYVYFTTDREDEGGSGRTGNVVNRVKLSGGDVEKIYDEGTTVSFIGREKDVVFFTEKKGSLETETYMKNVATESNSISNNKVSFISSSSTVISDITLIASETVSGQNETSIREHGYVYTIGSNLGFRRANGTSGVITFKNGEETVSSYKVLLITGRTVYLSTTTNIFRADISSVFSGSTTTVQLQSIVTMTAIHDGTLYAFDGTYIYYYAQLEEVEKEKDENGDEIEPEEDASYYMYRAKIGGTDKYELLGLTQINSRRS